MHNLTLAMIVKNEAPNILRCLESVSSFIDYYVIADTGSTDDTKKIIKEYFDSKNIPGEILDHEWEDFGTNRTKVLDHCMGKTKWAMMIDADDFIVGKLPVEKFNDELDGYIVSIARGDYQWKRAQVFNLAKTRWWYEEPLHEYAVCRLIDGRMNVEHLTGDFKWEVRTEGCRSRAFENIQEKYKNDYALLKKYLEKDPNQPRKQFYAAQSAFDAGMYDVAEQEYLARIAQGGWYEEVFFSWMRVGICREILKRPVETAADAFMMAFETAPNRVEPLCHLSALYRQHGRPRNAFLVASLGLTIPEPTDQILFVDSANYRWNIHDEVATTAIYAGRPQLGYALCDKLLREPFLPDDHRPRVAQNFASYSNVMEQIKQQAVEQQKAVAAKLVAETNKTTLDIKRDAPPVKL